MLATFSCLPRTTPLNEDFGTLNACMKQEKDYTQNPNTRDMTLWGVSCSADTSSNFSSVSSESPADVIAQMDALERIRTVLENASVSKQRFIEAENEYKEPNGIQTALARVADYHDTQYPLGKADTCLIKPITNECASVCVGTTQIEPIIQEAFAQAKSGNNLYVQAARLDAALLWFNYVSIYASMYLGRENPQGIDSARAYYAGGQTPSGAGIGISKYFKQLKPLTLSQGQTTDEKVWDGLRALRCWREKLGDSTPVVNPIDDSENDTRWKAARDQTDRALLAGIAAIVQMRLTNLINEKEAEVKSAHWAFVQTLGRFLLRAAENAAPDTDGATLLENELMKTDAAQVNASEILTAFQNEFPCS